MARNTYEDWIPEEWDGAVIQRVQQMSAVEARGRSYPMATDTRHVPRSQGVGVAGVDKGSPGYSEDDSTNDEIVISAKKFGRAIRIADEDLQDSHIGILEQKQVDWATSYAKYFDNATLAVTAAQSGTTVPFQSVYKALRTTNNDVSYTADDNYVAAASAQPTFDELSEVLGLYEQGDFFDASSTVVIAHPSFKQRLRGIKDDSNMPIFVQGQQGDSGTPDMLFDYPIHWSLGAKTSAEATGSPEGSAILVVGNAQFLAVGRRSGPESMVAPADSGAAFLTDEALLKMRARRGFAVSHEKAFAVLELA